MPKLGQVTIFIIIGCVLLGLTLAAIMLMSSLTKKELLVKDVTDSQVGTVKTYTQSCLAQTFQNGLLLMGKQGGYISLTPPKYTYFYSNVLKIPIYFDELVLAPDMEVLELQLGEYVKSNTTCNFEEFRKGGINITVGEISAKISFTNNTVIAKVVFPLDVNDGSSNTHLEQFTIEEESRIKQMYYTALSVANDPELQKGICISCMVQWASGNGFMIEEFDNVITGTVVIKITDSKHWINQEPQVFVFGIKESLGDEVDYE